jgi:hypothetical protein
MTLMLGFLPRRGRGTTRRVVEWHRSGTLASELMYPTTMLRMVPLPVPGRN